MSRNTLTTDQMKEQQASHWNNVASGWAAWIEWTERNFAPITDWFVEIAGWAPATRALDVGSGAGYPALLGAARVCPGGTMVATDISAAMVATVAERARARDLANLNVVQADAENLQFDDDVFEVVTSAYAFMFCPDPQRAINEACRVLVAGGRFALAVWDEAERSPFLTVINGVAAPILGLAGPQPGVPGPFRLASAGLLESMLREGGLRRVTVQRRAATFECASVEEYLQIFSDFAWRARLETAAAADRARLLDTLRAACRPFMQDGTLRLVATSLCAAGQKP